MNSSILDHVVNRRSLLAGGLGGTALAGLALAGCSTNDGDGGDSSSTTMTSWVFGQDSGDSLRETIQDLSESLEISVQEQTFPYLQYLNQVTLKARAGNIAGVAHIDEEWMSTLASAGALSDLSEIVDPSLYPERALQGGMYEGVRYAMPWTQSAIGMVGNSEILDAAGVNPAAIQSVDDFTAALRAIQTSDASVVPYAPCTAVEQLKDMVAWMGVFGCKIVDGGEVTLGDEGSIAALEYWKMLLDEGLIQAGVVRDDARTLFAQHRAAIYDDAPQAYGVIPPQSSDPDIASKMVPLARPPAPDGSGVNLMWSQPLVAFDDGEATVALLQALSTDLSGLERMFTASGQPPTTKEALESEWFTGNGFNTQWDEIVASSLLVNPLWSFPSATAAQTLFNEAVETALKGTASPQQAMEDAKTGLTDLLNG